LAIRETKTAVTVFGENWITSLDNHGDCYIGKSLINSMLKESKALAVLM
jgi:hypothetical protein